MTDFDMARCIRLFLINNKYVYCDQFMSKLKDILKNHTDIFPHVVICRKLIFNAFGESTLSVKNNIESVSALSFSFYYKICHFCCFL